MVNARLTLGERPFGEETSKSRELVCAPQYRRFWLASGQGIARRQPSSNRVRILNDGAGVSVHPMFAYDCGPIRAEVAVIASSDGWVPATGAA